MSRKKQRQREIGLRIKAKEGRQEELSSRGPKTQRERNGDNICRARGNVKSYLRNHNINVNGNQISYRSREFYYEVVDNGNIKVYAGPQQKVLGINPDGFPRDLKTFLNEAIYHENRAYPHIVRGF